MLKKSMHASRILALAATTSMFALMGCHTAYSQDDASIEAGVDSPMVVRGNSVAASDGQMEAAILVLGNDANAPASIVAATSMNGLEVSSLEGERIATMPAGEVIGLDVAYGFEIGGTSRTLIGAIDQASDSLRLFTLNSTGLQEVGSGAETFDYAAENVCFYRHALDGLHYAFIVGDGGQVAQNLLYETAGGKVSIRPVRQINVPSTIKQCVADAGSGTVFVSEESVGIWRFNADPESETGAAILDRVDRDHIDEEVGGLAVYDGGDDTRWLLASNLGAGTVNVYDLQDDGNYIGRFSIAGEDGEPMEEPGQLHAVGFPAGPSFNDGHLLIADEENSAVTLVTASTLAESVGRIAGITSDPRTETDARTIPVLPTVESVAVDNYGDAADDPVIWANLANPAASRVIATDKQEGLYVYDMNGKVIQFVADGKMNNVDLRAGFSLNGSEVTLVAASDRTHGTIAIYMLDETGGTLVDVANGPQPTGLSDPYGLCMAQDQNNGRTYVFINGDETRKRQWELVDAGNGKVNANLVRDLTFDSQTEGCVADDKSGTLYVGEEDVGIWKLSISPESGNTKTVVDTVEDNEFLVDDVEGLSIYHLDDGGGYLVASSQGDDTYAIFDLVTNEYIGSIAIVANAQAGIDGASETDGLDVSSANLGPGFEHGALVVQDGRNVMPSENQNYKYVPWSSIADVLNLKKN